MLTINRQQKELAGLLQNLSLSQRETDIFSTLLNLGKATAANIAEANSSIPRPSVYDVIKSLERQGLVSSFTQEGKKYFQIQDIEHIIDVVEDQKRRLTDKQNALRSAADLFKQIKSGTAYKPSVRFFEGKQGIMAIHRELQNAKEATKTIVDIASVAKIFPHILVTEDNLKDFQSYNIPKKDLMIKSAEAEKYLKVAPVTKTHRVKWLPSEVKFETDTLIWEGHTAILDYSQSLSGVIIDNPAIAKTFEAWFDIIWGNIKEEILYA